MFRSRNALLVVLIVAGLVCYSHLALAGLGDSQEQVITHMGRQPEQVKRGEAQLELGGDRTLYFVIELFKHLFEVQVTFIGNESVREVWFMMDKDREQVPIPEDIMIKLLSLNSQGNQWHRIPGFQLVDSDKDGKSDFSHAWFRSDKQTTTALVQMRLPNAIVFESDRYKRARDAVQ